MDEENYPLQENDNRHHSGNTLNPVLAEATPSSLVRNPLQRSPSGPIIRRMLKGSKDASVPAHDSSHPAFTILYTHRWSGPLSLWALRASIQRLACSNAVVLPGATMAKDTSPWNKRTLSARHFQRKRHMTAVRPFEHAWAVPIYLEYPGASVPARCSYPPTSYSSSSR